jgi:NADH:ubiquinone oxidoreductase subunit 2 (subunit N)
MVMYMSEPKASFELSSSPSLALALAISATAVTVIGVFPSDLLNYARASITGIM